MLAIKKKINFDINFVIFWHWSFDERTYVWSSSQICSILMALIYYLLFVVLGPIELKYSRKKGKGKEKKLVGKNNKDDYFQENAYTSHLTL